MFAQVLPSDPVLRTRQIWYNGQPLSANIRILSVGERFDCCCHGGDVALNTTEGVGWAGRKPLERIQTGVGVESSRLETKFARSRAVTLSENGKSGLGICSGTMTCRAPVGAKKLHTPKHGPGLVSTSCISLEATSAAFADKLNNVRIAVAAIRTPKGLVTAFRVWQFLVFILLKMEKTHFPIEMIWNWKSSFVPSFLLDIAMSTESGSESKWRMRLRLKILDFLHLSPTNVWI